MAKKSNYYNKNNKKVKTQEPPHLKRRRFAQDSVSVKDNYTQRPRQVSRSQVRALLKNPYNNTEQLQGVSLLLKATNGNYQRLVNYFSGMLTYDYLLYPVNSNTLKSPDKVIKTYEKSATFLDKMNLKYNLKWIGERIIELGEVFLYKIEDNKGIVFKEIPTVFCRVNRSENGVLLYQINLSKLNDSIIATMPVEIQNLYLKYKDGSLSKDDTDNGWIDISNNGVAFNFVSNSLPNGYPPLAFLFDKVMGLEDYEDLQGDVTKIDNLKLIHQQVPMNNETGELLIDADEAGIYHHSTKNNLPKGVAITTNPLKMNSISLAKSSTQSFDFVANALQSVYNSAGVNTQLFNGEKASGEVIKKGIVTDEMVAYRLLYLFINFVNAELQRCCGGNWKVKILECTYFNREEKMKVARENLAYGGSRMEFLAYCGFTPLEALNILRAEQIINFDTLLKPIQTSHTMNGSGDKGRPQEDEVSESGEKTREYK